MINLVIAFILALGVLVAIHEFGHFWVARRLGVKVLRFSIGFGKPLLRWRKSNESTEYVVAAIPLGGYVKMLDEREMDVPDEEKHLAFNRQGVWSRIAIVVAGPLANIILAVAVYTLIFIIGITGTRPIVGEVPADSLVSSAGFQLQDQIIKVADKETATWEQVRIKLLEELIDGDEIIVVVKDANGETQARIIPALTDNVLATEGDVIANMGFKVWWPELPPIIGEVIAGGAAEAAGLQEGDIILSYDGIKATSRRAWVKYIQENPEQAMSLEVKRGEEIIDINITPEKVVVDGKAQGLIKAKVNYSQLTQEQREYMQVLTKYGLFESITQGLVKTYTMSTLTLEMIGKLITGQASVSNISGPVRIAEYAGRSLDIGFRYYLDFIALLSVSLAVLNILPIPLLDGGHLLYYIIELVRGKPVSELTEMLGQRIGIALLAGLMMLAFYNDLLHLLSK